MVKSDHRPEYDSIMPSCIHQDLTTSQPGVLETGGGGAVGREQRCVFLLFWASACDVGRLSSTQDQGPSRWKVAFVRIPAQRAGLDDPLRR